MFWCLFLWTSPLWWKLSVDEKEGLRATRLLCISIPLMSAGRVCAKCSVITEWVSGWVSELTALWMNFTWASVAAYFKEGDVADSIRVRFVWCAGVSLDTEARASFDQWFKWVTLSPPQHQISKLINSFPSDFWTFFCCWCPSRKQKGNRKRKGKIWTTITGRSLRNSRSPGQCAKSIPNLGVPASLQAPSQGWCSSGQVRTFR